MKSDVDLNAAASSAVRARFTCTTIPEERSQELRTMDDGGGINPKATRAWRRHGLVTWTGSNHSAQMFEHEKRRICVLLKSKASWHDGFEGHGRYGVPYAR